MQRVFAHMEITNKHLKARRVLMVGVREARCEDSEEDLELVGWMMLRWPWVA